jgi:O-succinylbenzoate synthase
MKLSRLVIRHVKMDLVRGFETSFGRVEDQETIIVEAWMDDDLVGYGEAPAQAEPFYSYETVHTVMHILRDFAGPMLLAEEFRDPTVVPAILSRIRGHNMAKAALEAACWDLHGQIHGGSIADAISGTQKTIPVGISLGIEPTVDELLRKVEQGVSDGYTRVKIKIKPGWDRDVLASVRGAYPNLTIWADVNGAYGPEDLDLLMSLQEFNLGRTREPGRPLRDTDLPR